MKRLAIAGAVLVVLSGCGLVQAQRWREAANRADQIMSECRDKRLAGVLSGHVASVRCSNERVRLEYAESGFPYMDLIDLQLAHRAAIARRFDAGTLSEEDAILQLAEYSVRINTEMMRRDAARMQAYTARQAAVQAIGSDLQTKDKLRRMENRQRQIEQKQRNLQGCLQNYRLGAVACQ